MPDVEMAAAQSIAFGLPYDGLICFVTRMVRMFNYGAIAPIFFLYCLQVGLDEVRTGILLTCILVGDLFITLYLSTRADIFGRRNTLIVGSLLKVLAGVVFATTGNYFALTLAGIIGVISTSGGEIGPFMAIEQAALTDSVLLIKSAAKERQAGSEQGTKTSAGDVAVIYGWYNALGYMSQAVGAGASGVAISELQSRYGWTPIASYRAIFVVYSGLGVLMAFVYATMTQAAEAMQKPKPSMAVDDEPAACCPSSLSRYAPALNVGLRRKESRYIVARLSVMFAMDAFAGAFVMQTWIAYWFHEQWGFTSDLIGYLIMGANIVAGLSGVAAAYFVKNFGAMLTMIASHLPSNILLLAVPFMPTGWAAAAMLVARFSISQMDVPARQAYVVMVVASDERSAAGGITNIVRSLGSSLAPSIVGYVASFPPRSLTFSSPWVIAGCVKIVYDVVLYVLYLSDNTMNSGESIAAARETAEARSAENEAERPLLVDEEGGNM